MLIHITEGIILALFAAACLAMVMGLTKKDQDEYKRNNK